MRYKRTYLYSLIIVIILIFYINYDRDSLFNSNDLNKKINLSEYYDDYDFEGNPGKIYYVWKKDYLKAKGYWNHGNFTPEEIKSLSIMGRRSFLHEEIGFPQQKHFVIYIYKFGPRLENRLIKRYTKNKLDPFEKCSVRNCRISYDHNDFESADAVLFHLHLIPGPPTELQRSNYKQRWVWMSDESSFNTFSHSHDRNLEHYDNFFNWSMTYRVDSDVPVPYGRVVPLLNDPVKPDLDIYSKKNKTIAIMGSNCGGRNNRWNYAKMMEKYIQIDTYGHCGKLKCPGHYGSDCSLLNDYKFYLSFENSNCKDYITEKVWWNAFNKESVPVVMGAPKSNYVKLLPPNSFIHVDDFDSPEQLALYITHLSNNKEAYNKYHFWRSRYKVLNEHGYFQAEIFHYCRLCEALNYNSPLSKTYKSMTSFWNSSKYCNSIKYPKR